MTYGEMLVHLREKRAALDRVIEGLELLAGERSPEERDAIGGELRGLDPDVAPAPIDPSPPAPLDRRPFLSRAVSDVRRAMLLGKNRPKAIREATGLPKWKVDAAISELERQGQIEGSGTTRSRTYRFR